MKEQMELLVLVLMEVQEAVFLRCKSSRNLLILRMCLALLMKVAFCRRDLGLLMETLSSPFSIFLLQQNLLF